MADLGMPRDEGLRGLSRVRESGDAATAQTPVIAVTDAATAEGRAQAAAAGFAGRMSRPIDESQLIAVILASSGRQRE